MADMSRLQYGIDEMLGGCPSNVIYIPRIQQAVDAITVPRMDRRLGQRRVSQRSFNSNAVGVCVVLLFYN